MMSAAEAPVGWVECSEPHQETAQSWLVGLATMLRTVPLDPPYPRSALRHRN